MNDIIREIEAEQLKENAPEFRVGDTVKVYGKIKEGNRERVQVFEGIVLKIQNGGNRTTFTVLCVIALFRFLYYSSVKRSSKARTSGCFAKNF